MTDPAWGGLLLLAGVLGLWAWIRTAPVQPKDDDEED